MGGGGGGGKKERRRRRRRSHRVVYTAGLSYIEVTILKQFPGSQRNELVHFSDIYYPIKERRQHLTQLRTFHGEQYRFWQVFVVKGCLASNQYKHISALALLRETRVINWLTPHVFK